MKIIFYSMIAAVLMITACQTKTETLPVDAVAEKDSIAKNLDMMYSAYTSKDAKAFLSLVADDCYFCGTDSKEFWDLAAYTTILNEMFADTAFQAPTFTVDKREIRLDKDGKSAIAVDQFFFAGWSDRIPLRNVTHHVKVDNKWLCNFSSMSFVPNNEDLSTIFKSLSE